MYSPSSFHICNTVLLTVVTMLYITLSGLVKLITGILYLLTTFTHLHIPTPQVVSV